MSDDDHIGVVREHRWASVALQRQRLKADGCRVILDLDRTPRSDVERLTREGTVIKVLHVVFYADPRSRRKKGGTKADLLPAIKRLVCKPPVGRRGILKDVATGLTTADPQQKAAIMALAKDQCTRDGKGLKSVENGARNRGRQELILEAGQWAAGKAVWRDTIEYPTWADAAEGLKKVHKDFTVYRANRLWGPRKSKSR